MEKLKVLGLEKKVKFLVRIFNNDFFLLKIDWKKFYSSPDKEK